MVIGLVEVCRSHRLAFWKSTCQDHISQTQFLQLVLDVGPVRTVSDEKETYIGASGIVE